jgi:hypothetical protein
MTESAVNMVIMAIVLVSIYMPCPRFIIPTHRFTYLKVITQKRVYSTK